MSNIGEDYIKLQHIILTVLYFVNQKENEKKILNLRFVLNKLIFKY